MARAIDKETMLGLIIKAKRTDPETGSFAEWLAEYLVEHLPTLTLPNEWVSVETPPITQGWYHVAVLDLKTGKYTVEQDLYSIELAKAHVLNQVFVKRTGGRNGSESTIGADFPHRLTAARQRRK